VWTSKPSIADSAATAHNALGERSASNGATVGGPSVDGLLAFPRPAANAAGQVERTAVPRISTVVDLARGLNRLDPIAIEIASRDPDPDILVEGSAVRKLVGAFWFRSIFPKLSPAWRERLFDALAGSVVIPNHVVSRARQKQPVHLADGICEELRAIAATTAVSGAAGADLQLVLAIVGLWGDDARRRLRFVDVPAPEPSSRLGTLLGMWRGN
jgi:hypothetical protein